MTREALVAENRADSEEHHTAGRADYDERAGQLSVLLTGYRKEYQRERHNQKQEGTKYDCCHREYSAGCASGRPVSRHQASVEGVAISYNCPVTYD
jgi:hypothetical protein